MFLLCKQFYAGKVLKGIIIHLQMIAPALSEAAVVEESTVDPVNQQFVTYTRNFTAKKYLLVEERCTYTASPENSNW